MKGRLFTLSSVLIVLALTALFLLPNAEAVRGSILRKQVVNLQEYPSDLVIASARYDYETLERPSVVTLAPGASTTVSVALKNTGNVIWSHQDAETPLYLGLTRPNDRESVFYQEGIRGWAHKNRISMVEEVVRPGEIAHFAFEVVAPKKEARYTEYFRPVIDGVEWLRDTGLALEVVVAREQTKVNTLAHLVNGKPNKHILVDLSQQRLYAYEGGLERYVFVTSTGLIGMDTPVGEFRIHNKYPTAYSEPYDLYMDNWMAFTADGKYGLHSLPFWKFKDGSRLYEGEEHLGTPVSHGCIRTGIAQSKILYDWAEVGTAVTIIH